MYQVQNCDNVLFIALIKKFQNNFSSVGVKTKIFWLEYHWFFRSWAWTEPIWLTEITQESLGSNHWCFTYHWTQYFSCVRQINSNVSSIFVSKKFIFQISSHFEVFTSNKSPNLYSLYSPPFSLNFSSSSSKRGLRFFPGCHFGYSAKFVKLPTKDNRQPFFWNPQVLVLCQFFCVDQNSNHSHC